VAGLADALQRLQGLAERVVRHHAAQHPLLSTDDNAAAAVPLTVGRLHDAAVDLQRFCRALDGDDDADGGYADGDGGVYVAGDPRGRRVMLSYHVHTRRQLTEMLVVARENGTARDGPAVPLTPFTLYTEVAQMGAFLRRLTAYHRPRLIQLLRGRDPLRWDCEPLGPGGPADVPQIRLRMGERWLINWRHVHRVMWPQQHAALAAQDGEAEAPSVAVYAAYITVGAPSRLPPQNAAAP
jgi:hypothetical protein